MEKRSRRRFIGSILALLSWPRRRNSLKAASPPAPQSDSGAGARTTVRRYRADAVILLLGIPLYRRAGVGSGQVSVEESGEGAQLRKTLFFAGGSDPKRAVGLNRLGWLREVGLGGPDPSETDYFGVLSSSPEESLEHARTSVAAPQSSRSPYTAVSGRHTVSRSRSAVTHFEFASGANWSDHGLIDEAQSTFRGNVQWRETSWPSNHPPPTFLFQLADLLRQRGKRASGRYVYNEQEYLLDLETSRESGRAERLLAVRGVVRNQRTGHPTPFRVWVEDSPGSIVPVRIEFQPRAFLRLAFEALPA